MVKIPLTGGAYQARSVIASSQKCVNLYPESAPAESQSPVPVVHYPTPGVRSVAQSVTKSVVRGLWRAGSTGDLYAVIGANVYFIDATFAATLLGSIADRHTPVSMSDNGDVLVLVDGTASGYAIDLTTRAFGAITGAAFYGADRVDCLDTYFLFNRPGTRQFYISLSQVSFAMLTGGTAFDALDIAAKTGGGDNIVSLIVMHREIWLVGALTAEVWVNTGASDFTFGELPGAFIDHGCVAPYSVAKQDVSVFWLSQDREGRGIVVKGTGYQVERVSTHAIEAEFQAYSRIDDAIGYCYQQQGHAFYVITFPTADKSWGFELATKQWHELVWTDQNGNPHRHRANCCTYAYGQNIVGDWQTGELHALDPTQFTDNGRPIVRIRTFPHLINDGLRVTYNSFAAYMQAGTLPGSSSRPTQGSDFNADFNADFGGPRAVGDNPPILLLRCSDDGGVTYGNAMERSIGAGGEYLTQAMWRRLGMARDRVFELSWSAPLKTALLGCFVEVTKHDS